jgi:hypothetical protein
MQSKRVKLHLTPLFAVALGIALAILCIDRLASFAYADDEGSSLLRTDQAAFASGNASHELNDSLFDTDLSWTNSSGNTRNKSEILKAIRSGENLALLHGAVSTHVNGLVGIVQENIDKIYVLRIWIKRSTGWQLLVYHAVSTSTPPSAASDDGGCENPCNDVPFQPRSADQRDVIRTYQAVERAVTAHDSAEWGAHIADEFFAVTSNSNRPLDKRTRMAGLDNQKVAGIAPFPLVSARMFEFGDVMIMTSKQQPVHGSPLHVTRIWFKRGAAWLEAYSYQTTISQ